MSSKGNATWISLSPRQIFLRFEEIVQWRKDAEKIFENLPNREDIKRALKKLLGKTSAKEALKVMTEISSIFNLPDLAAFCTIEKFTGLLGVNHVASIALSGIFFHSRIEKDIRTFFGKVVIDSKMICQLSIPMEMHKEIQDEINRSNYETNMKLYDLIQQIGNLHRCKNYSVKAFRSIRKEIDTIISNDPMYYLLVNVGIAPEAKENNKDEDYNFFHQARNKEAGGFFQNLCISLLSLNFPAFQNENSVK